MRTSDNISLPTNTSRVTTLRTWNVTSSRCLEHFWLAYFRGPDVSDSCLQRIMVTLYWQSCPACLFRGFSLGMIYSDGLFKMAAHINRVFSSGATSPAEKSQECSSCLLLCYLLSHVYPDPILLTESCVLGRQCPWRRTSRLDICWCGPGPAGGPPTTLIKSAAHDGAPRL